ncbi:MAG: hypothetical protein AABY33_06940 [Pseudomonadota bacterium]
MRNSVRKKQEQPLAVNIPVIAASANAENSDSIENIVEFVARDRLIAQQCEDACHLAGNNSSPDFDEFEAKYGLGCFA